MKFVEELWIEPYYNQMMRLLLMLVELCLFGVDQEWIRSDRAEKRETMRRAAEYLQQPGRSAEIPIENEQVDVVRCCERVCELFRVVSSCFN